MLIVKEKIISRTAELPVFELKPYQFTSFFVVIFISFVCLHHLTQVSGSLFKIAIKFLAR